MNCARRCFYQYANHLPNRLLSIELKYPDFFYHFSSCFVSFYIFDPCSIYSHLIVFSASYYTSFTSLAFRRGHCSYPSSSSSALVFISAQHVSGTFSRRYGHSDDTDTVASPLINCSFSLRSKIFFTDPFFFQTFICYSKKQIDVRS